MNFRYMVLRFHVIYETFFKQIYMTIRCDPNSYYYNRLAWTKE